jgi:mono/diheme cytochrome c family protein
MHRERVSALVALALFAVVPAVSSAADRSAVDRFEAKVRPLLIQHCTRCHGPDKQRGGLRLDSARALAKGGESGPVVVPGKPDESRLVEAVRYAGDLKMPPKSRLSEADVAALVAWVRDGAVWPAAAAPANTSKPATAGRRALVTDEDRAFWAFRPVRDPAPPAVRDESWPASPLDRFILAGLEAAGLRPAPQADRKTLIRRLTFDLTGLPPTPETPTAWTRTSPMPTPGGTATTS